MKEKDEKNNLLRTPFNRIDGYPIPIYLDIPGAQSLPVKLIRGRNLTMRFSFEASRTIRAVASASTMTFLGQENQELKFIEIDYTNAILPFKNGEEVETYLSFPVLAEWPKMRVDIDIRLRDQDRVSIVGFNFSGHVVDS